MSERPYSLNELTRLHSQNLNHFKLSLVKVSHPDCGHTYHIRSGGRREGLLTRSKGLELGNCSVCWRTTRESRDIDRLQKFYNGEQVDSIHLVFEEYSFYDWLYGN